MDTIAFVVKRYLNLTETFIYEPLRNIKSYDVIVLTEERRNLEQFPHRAIYSLSDLLLLQRALPLSKRNFYRKILKEKNAKLIHAHFAWEGIDMFPLKQQLNLPLITSFYGVDIYSKNPIYLFQIRNLFKRGDLFLTFSERMRKHTIALGCPEEKIKTHYGGADFKRLLFKERKLEEEIKILMVGRFVEKKGFDYGIKAFAAISRIRPNIRLRIIGDGEKRDNLQKLVSGLNIKNKVEFLGVKTYKEYINELYNSHILLAPSVAAPGDEEGGINTVVIEAMATGMPVLATEHSGSELVFDGKTGYIARERDESNLSQKLNQMLKGPNLWQELGINSRKLIEEKFDIVKQTEKLEQIYKELITKYERI